MASSDRYMPQEWALPEVTDVSRAFFTSGELRLQRCRQCEAVQHPPLDVCHTCRSFEFDYVTAEPKGIVDSFTIVHHPFNGLLDERVPFNIAVITLPDHADVRIVGNVIDAEPDDMAIGLAVDAVWVDIPDNGDGVAVKLPQWRRRAGSAQTGRL
jgi:uncharacterized protein